MSQKPGPRVRSAEWDANDTSEVWNPGLPVLGCVLRGVEIAGYGVEDRTSLRQASDFRK